MRVGFLTSTFNDRPFEEIVDFARDSGFDAIEVNVNHFKTPDNVAKCVTYARDSGLYVCSTVQPGNQLDPDPAKREELRARTGDYARATAEAGVPVFVCFPGHDRTVDEDTNYRNFADHVNALLAANARLEVAIENWPGPENAYIAVTPDGWNKLFGLVPDERFGVEFDPSHLVRLGIDPHAAYEGVKGRVKMFHGKDTSFDRTRLQAVGYHGAGWWRYRLPGSGVLDWNKMFRQTQASGYAGPISIEHEDADFGWPLKDLDARKRGELQALEFLRGVLSSPAR